MIGKIISHYRILEKLGKGGMGVVFKAEDIKLKRTIALKFLPEHLSSNKEACVRFEREAQAAAALNHPNIITIHEIGEYDGQIFIAMEYVGGESLQEILSESKNGHAHLSVNEILDISAQICRGLQKAHEAGIVHRDIKPGNILIDQDGRVKLLDFGLVKLKGVSKLTKEVSTIGTVNYMSPEQALGEETDHRSDIWSLGVVLYEMLTGQLPFKGEYEQIVLYSIINTTPEAMNGLRVDFPHDFELIVNKALEKNKENRYQNINELHMDLLRLQEIINPVQEKQSLLAGEEKLKKQNVQSFKKRVRSLKNLLSYIYPVKLWTRFSSYIITTIILSLIFLILRSVIFNKAIISDQKSIAVISFENKTGDNTYDYLQAAIPNLLITSLEQSKNLRVTTWERLHDLLKQMGKKNVEIINEDLGLELCFMDDIDVVVLGSFTKNGEIFTTNLDVLNVNTKNVIITSSSDGEGISSILKKQIDELSRDISRGVGISDQIIEATQQPITEVTTTSMDAYNYFLRGREDWEKYYNDDARLFLEKAIQLDSTFAVAYLYLAWSYGALGNTKAMRKASEKAKLFARKATDKESLYIEADYVNIIGRDFEQSFHIFRNMVIKYPKEKRVHSYLAYYYRSKNLYNKAIQEYNKALELDPNYGEALNNLAYTYAVKGDYEKSIVYLQKYASVYPGDANPFDSIAETYFRMGMLEKAIEKYKQALEVKSDFYYAYWSIGYIYALKEDFSKTIQWIEKSIDIAPSPGIEAEGYVLKSFYHFWLGNSKQSQSDLITAGLLAKKVGNELWEAFVDWMRGWIYYDKGYFQNCEHNFKGWYNSIIRYPLPDKPSQSIPFYESDYNLYLGLVDLKLNRIDSTNLRLKEVGSLVSEIDQAVKDRTRSYYNLLKGEALLSEGSLNKAISVCENTSPMGIPPYMRSRYILLYNVPIPSDVLARAYVNKGNIDKAITKYERLITFDPNSKDRRLIHPKYHFRLAKLYEEKGMLEKAKEQYEKFLDIWKDADEDQPDLIDAKKRLAALLD